MSHRLAVALVYAAAILGFGALMALIASCSKSPITSTPSSSLTKSTATAWASMWTFQKPGNTIGFVYPTGSMVPTFDDSSVLLEELPVNPLPQVGDICVYQNPSLPDVTIVHRIADASAGWYRFEGDHNPGPDARGVPLSAIRYRVAGILYSHR